MYIYDKRLLNSSYNLNGKTSLKRQVELFSIRISNIWICVMSFVRLAGRPSCEAKTLTLGIAHKLAPFFKTKRKKNTCRAYRHLMKMKLTTREGGPFRVKFVTS